MKKLFERVFLESLKDDMDKYEKDARSFGNQKRRLDYVNYKTFRYDSSLGYTTVSLGKYELFVCLRFDYDDYSVKPEKRTINNTIYTFYTKWEEDNNVWNKTCRDNECPFDSFTKDVLIQHLKYVYANIDEKEIEPYLDEAMEQIENMAQKSWENWQYKIKVYPKRTANINNIIKKRNKDFHNRLSDLKKQYLKENPFVIGAKIRDEYNPRELWIVDDIDEENDIIYLRAPEEGIERWVYIDNDEKPPRKGTVFADGQKVAQVSRADDYNDAAYLLRAEPGTIIERKLSDIKKEYFKNPTSFNLKNVRKY